MLCLFPAYKVVEILSFTCIHKINYKEIVATDAGMVTLLVTSELSFIHRPQTNVLGSNHRTPGWKPNRILAFVFQMHQCKITLSSLEFQVLKEVNMFKKKIFTNMKNILWKKEETWSILLNDNQRAG